MAEISKPSFIDLPVEIQELIVEYFYEGSTWIWVLDHSQNTHKGHLVSKWDFDMDYTNAMFLTDRYFSNLARKAMKKITCITLDSTPCNRDKKCHITGDHVILAVRPFYTFLLKAFPSLTNVTALKNILPDLGFTRHYITMGTLQELIDDDSRPDYITLLELEFLNHSDLDFGRARIQLPEPCQKAELAALFGHLTIDFEFSIGIDGWEIGDEDKHLVLDRVCVDLSIGRDGCKIVDKWFESGNWWDPEEMKMSKLPAGSFTFRAFKNRYSGVTDYWVGRYPETDMRIYTS